MSCLLDALQQQRKPLRISTGISLFSRCSSDSLSSPSSQSNQNIMSGTTPGAGILQYSLRVLCLHDFETLDPIHLPFFKGEVLTIIKQENSGWWAAMRPKGDRIGWIPSSFVLPLDKCMTVEYRDETLAQQPRERLNDLPPSAVHDPWVPVSEDCAALRFWPITPTDLVRRKDSIDDGTGNYNYESSFSLSDSEQVSQIGDVYILPTSENSPPHRVQRPHTRYPPPLEPDISQLARPGSSPLPDAALHHSSSRMNDPTSCLCLATPINSDETTPELMSSLSLKDSVVAFRTVAISQDGTHLCNEVDSTQSQHFGSPMGFHPAGPDQSVDFVVWGPDRLAEQLCVLMHTLYAVIRQNDCLDWTANRKSTDITGLQDFFDVHDYIASWVQKSILAYDDITQQAETLDFWIRVAETCRSFRNFDSLYAIVSALTGLSLSSSGSILAQCAHETFGRLRDMLDGANQSNMGIVDTTAGPSIPFIWGYLDHHKELCVESFETSPRASSGHAADVGPSAALPLRTLRIEAVSALLCHQSSPYDFGITGSLRSFLDDKLNADI